MYKDWLAFFNKTLEEIQKQPGNSGMYQRKPTNHRCSRAFCDVTAQVVTQHSPGQRSFPPNRPVR
ncbi:hypothetical protein E2C01_007489 [Portunus trituberculatus]|uniref:Uncharacterized protein n=1 Tax=Portunus trituberculatus TaxID=210409 RepID=A0A5B7CZK6_PORTR|nr:hypothetical protein [Portunus trituberculatus]